MPDAMEVGPSSELGEMIQKADEETTPIRREAASSEAPPEERLEKVTSMKQLGEFNKAFTLNVDLTDKDKVETCLAWAKATANNLSPAHCYLLSAWNSRVLLARMLQNQLSQTPSSSVPD